MLNSHAFKGRSSAGFVRQGLEMAKSKMPVFSADDEEELRRIIDGDGDMFKKNLPSKNKGAAGVKAGVKGSAALPVQPAKPPSLSAARPIDPSQGHVKPLMKPNDDWRAAMTSPAYYSTDSLNRASYSGKPRVMDEYRDPFEEDFSYEDMETALQEEHFYGTTGEGGVGIKHSKVVKEHDGLRSGDVLPPYAWTWLTDADGTAYDFSKAHLNTSDVVVLVSSPRRMTEDFNECIRQFAKIPRNSLRIQLVAVNCDAPSDLRKFVKKSAASSASCSVLSDGTKKVRTLSCATLSVLNVMMLVVYGGVEVQDEDASVVCTGDSGRGEQQDPACVVRGRLGRVDDQGHHRRRGNGVQTRAGGICAESDWNTVDSRWSSVLTSCFTHTFVLFIRLSATVLRTVST